MYTCVEVEKDDPETTGSSTQDLDCANSDDLVKDQAQESVGMWYFVLIESCMASLGSYLFYYLAMLHCYLSKYINVVYR